MVDALTASPGGADPRLAELQQLQREYKNIESNRRMYAEESQQVLRRQQMNLDKLRREQDDLKDELALLHRSTTRPMTIEQQQRLEKLTLQGEKYVQAISEETQNSQIMEEQIQLLQEKLQQQRKVMGGVNAAKDNHQMIQKQIRILENRLEKSLVKFNESISHNKKLREEIDSLRRERIVFENIYRKLERSLIEKKRVMAEIIESSNQAYEQRDNFQMEIAALEASNRRNRENFEHTMTELSEQLDQAQLPAPSATLMQSLLASRTGTAGTDGGNGSSPVKHRSSRSLAHSQSMGGSALLPPMSNPNSTANGIRQSKSAGTLPGSPLHLPPAGGATNQNSTTGTTEIDFRERAANFEEAFNKIRSATGIQDIDELVRTFIKNEEHNFSLFNYVNEQNNEIEKLEESLASLREEKMKYAAESGHDVLQHKEILNDLEKKLAHTDTMVEKYDLRCQDLARILESLKRGMTSIFSKLDVADSAAAGSISIPHTTEDGGETSTPVVSTTTATPRPAIVITEVNMVHYLAILEKKSMELLTHYRHLESLSRAPNETVREFLHSSGLLGNDKISAPSPVLSGLTLGAPSHLVSESLVNLLGTGPKSAAGKEQIKPNFSVKPTEQTAEEEDEEEDETRPLTREELEMRLKKTTNSTSIASNLLSSIDPGMNDAKRRQITKK